MVNGYVFLVIYSKKKFFIKKNENKFYNIFDKGDFMKCPYCNTPVVYHDYHGKTKTIDKFYTHRQYIYKCLNHKGFKNPITKNEYLLKNPDLNQNEEIVCESAKFGGFFHTNSKGELLEGYPLPDYDITNEQIARLIDVSIRTLRDNLHLCDGNNCTLKDLRDAVANIDPLWEK